MRSLRLRMIAAGWLGMMTVSLAVPAFAWPAPHPAKPAACHGDEAPTPVPSPAGYECCATGHNIAVPAPSFAADSPIAFLGAKPRTAPTLGTHLFPGGAAFVNPILDDASPGLTPLRI